MAQIADCGTSVDLVILSSSELWAHGKRLMLKFKLDGWGKKENISFWKGIQNN